MAGLGAISGRVHDPTGAIIPGASVVVSNEARGLRREMLSTEAGAFSVPALVPGRGYSMTVALQGFKTWEARDFEVQVVQTVDFNMVLEVAGATAEISVNAEAPLVENTKSGVSEVVTQEQIDSLPINGRRVDTFVLLTPAVVPDGTFGLVSFRGIAAGNAFLTDGNDTTNSFYNENAGRTRIASQISQDAVQEFQVITSGFSAEYGRSGGAVFSVVLKSGTNKLHGNIYEYVRNSMFNARNPFTSIDSAGKIIPQNQMRFNNFGGTLGGPMRRS